MVEEEYEALIKRLAKGLPKFPDGRIDYTYATAAPVVNCVLLAEGRVLLLKRSDQVLAYAGKWNGVSGFIDTFEPAEVIARREIREETGLADYQMRSFALRNHYHLEDPSASKEWFVFPILVELHTTHQITLNEEHTEYKWVPLPEVNRHDTLPNFAEVVRQAIK